MELEATYSHTKIEIWATSRICCVKYSHLDYKLKSFWWTMTIGDFSCHESSQNHLRCLHLDAVRWQRLLWHRANDDIREAQGRRRRSGVRPKGHMVSSGVASACNPDTRSQTFTWMGSNASVCVCVRYDCILAACVPCVMGPWHLLMKKSSWESSRGCKLPCHSRIRSHRSVTLARGRSDMLPSRFLQVIIATEVIQSSYVPVIWTCCFIHIFSFKSSSEAIKSSGILEKLGKGSTNDEMACGIFLDFLQLRLFYRRFMERTFGPFSLII